MTSHQAFENMTENNILQSEEIEEELYSTSLSSVFASTIKMDNSPCHSPQLLKQSTFVPNQLIEKYYSSPSLLYTLTTDDNLQQMEVQSELSTLSISTTSISSKSKEQDKSLELNNTSNQFDSLLQEQVKSLEAENVKKLVSVCSLIL